MTSPDADLATPVGLHDCATCNRCATTFAIVHPVCPKCAERDRLEAEIARLRAIACEPDEPIADSEDVLQPYSPDADLATLLNQATPGPWEPELAAVVARGFVIATTQRDSDAGTYETMDADARLIALAPDMARLLIDMADFVRTTAEGADLPASREVLLSRFAALNAKAGETT